MADEPDNLVLRLLRDIRSMQETQGVDLKYLKGRADDLYKISTDTLGVAVNAHERYETLEAAVRELTEPAQRLETKVD